VWPVMDTEERWLRCCEGTCHCRPETVTLSCWRQELRELPIDQVVPKDVRVMWVHRSAMYQGHILKEDSGFNLLLFINFEQIHATHQLLRTF